MTIVIDENKNWLRYYIFQCDVQNYIEIMHKIIITIFIKLIIINQAFACTPARNYVAPSLEEKYNAAAYIIDAVVEGPGGEWKEYYEFANQNIKYLSFSEWQAVQLKKEQLITKARNASKEAILQIRRTEKNPRTKTYKFYVIRWLKGQVQGPEYISVKGFVGGGSCLSGVPRGRAIIFTKGNIADGVLKASNLGIYSSVFKGKWPTDKDTNKELDSSLIIAIDNLKYDAVNPELNNEIKLLLEKGANSNIINYKGEAPIFIATQKDQVEIIESLAKHGAYVNFKNKSNWTALFYARSGEAIEILSKYGVNLDYHTEDRQTALYRNIRQGSTNAEHIKTLLNLGSDPSIYPENVSSLLVSVLSIGNEEIIEGLIKNGADPNIKVFGGKPILNYYLTNKNLKLAETLLKNGANPNYIVTGQVLL